MRELYSEVPAEATVEDLEHRIEMLREEHHQVKQLSDSPGWATFRTVVQGNAESLGQNRFSRLNGIDEAIQHNYFVGLRDGLNRAIVLLEEIDELYKQAITLTEKALTEKENARSSDAEPEQPSSDADSEPELPLQHAP